MGYCNQISQPSFEPVSLAEAKAWINPPGTADDAMIATLITAAREHAEVITGRALAQRNFAMVLDCHPYYTDSIVSQQAYPPSYYSLPHYSTTLWNYSQMIKLPFPPVKAVSKMRSVNTDGTIREMLQDVDFILDRHTEYARIFPKPGAQWPADLYVANALEIFFTAGFDGGIDQASPADTDPDVHTTTLPSQQPDSTVIFRVPRTIKTALLMLVAHWYDNRWGVMAENLKEVPLGIQNLLIGQAVFDFAAPRG